jgi:transcriptional regulator with XRE-family HTH domain
MYQSYRLQPRERLITIGPMMDEAAWNDRLRRARRVVGMTQAALAQAAGISMQTVRAYERRRRHPTRPHLVAMLDALRVERGERNTILTSAGFAADGRSLRPPGDDLAFTRAEAGAEVRCYRWPAFVTDEFATVVSANRAAETLWAVDVAEELADAIDRNLLTVLSNPRFADHVLNWEEAVTIVISVFKGHHRGGEDLDHPSP